MRPAQLLSTEHRPSATQSRSDGAQKAVITESYIIWQRDADTATGELWQSNESTCRHRTRRSPAASLQERRFSPGCSFSP
eukprot:scaffold35552_cov55-Phaeocystis_antarctica.AAC.1